MITKITVANGVILVSLLAACLSGCDVLSDPEFLNAVQGATQQIQNNAQVQQSFSQCMQTAGTPDARSACLSGLTQGLAAQ